jgi:predicted Zn-dependent protease
MSMPSDAAPGSTNAFRGRFSHSRSAGSWIVDLTLDHRGVIIHGAPDETEPLVWPFGALTTHTPISRGAGEVLVGYARMPDTTLYVDDHDFVVRLCDAAPQLTTSSHRWRWLWPSLAATVLIGVVIAIAYFVNAKPARTIAKLMPQSVRQQFGQKVVKYMAGRHQLCVSPQGQAALEKIFNRLLPDAGKRANFKVVAVDWGLVNAFAAPGGRILVTRGLIQSAHSAEEVAGVLAHEIGHGLELHPEAGIVRALGVSTLLDIMMGGSSGTMGSITGYLIQTRYARGDERAADVQALRLMRNSAISQGGLADFFERIGKKQGKNSILNGKGGAGAAFDLIRTHPRPGERAGYVRATAKYPSRPVLRTSEWADLRSICSKTSNQ